MRAAWLLLAWCVVVLMFGEALQLPDWLRALSPFEHLALAPAEEIDPLPVVAVAAVAAAASVAGQLAFRRRDIG